MAESCNPDNVWQPFGAFSMMVLQGSGQVVHLKGQVSLDRSGTIIGPGDMRAQVRQVLTNIKTVLAAVGGKMGDVISLVHYTTDIAAFMQTGDIRQEFFADPYPVTTTVEVAALYNSDLVIEITAVAEIPKDRYKAPAAAQAMHQ
ncbi:Rid family hydrolase [Anderseniella sp. Alg231-50]|uniref:Rid family hydrolase n=1 Tax=Anderseniella sp. Alg231-50 TaxID=1922226 RepID=UPI000D55D2DF